MYEEKLSESMQDYLKIIYFLEKKNRVARIKEIANEKGVSMPSVSEAMKKLSEQGWINYKTRGHIELSPKGNKAANYFITRNLFIRNFLRDILGNSDEIAEQEACSLEHHLGSQSIKRLGLLYQFLTHCPKTEKVLIDEFKNCFLEDICSNYKNSDNVCFSGEYPHIDSHKNINTLVSSLSIGTRAKILLVSPFEDERTNLFNLGILPGLILKLVEKNKESNNCIISIKEQNIPITLNQAEKIEVAIIPELQGK